MPGSHTQRILDHADSFVRTVLKHTSEGFVKTLNAEVIRRMFGGLLALYALKIGNQFLSHWALNNWTRSYPWKADDELVLLTGGCGGIGKQVTLDLVKKGVKVVVVDICQPNSPLADNAFFYEADITSSKSIKDIADKIRRDHGDPTVLINNAGLGFADTILDVPEERLRKTFEVNNISQFLMVKEFLPNMIRNNHGHIITIASMASFVTLGEMVDYGCTKAGVLAFHEGLAQELRHWHKAPRVRTSIIHPIFVNTPMIKHYTDKGLQSRQPLLTPEDVSKAIVGQVLAQASGQVILPKGYSVLSLVRAMPHWIQEQVRGYGSLQLKNIRASRK